TTLGINLKKFFLSWLFIGIIFSIFSFYLNDKIATKCFREGQNLFYTKVKKQPIENNIIKNLFYHNNNKKGVTTYFFLDKYDKKTSKIWHFILEEYKNDSLLLQIYAKEGIKQNSKIILYNCIIRHFDNHKIVSEKIVRRYIYPLFVDLENFRYDFSSIQLDQLNLKELKLALKIANYKNEPLYRIHTEISFRYAISFLNFILILFSIALGKNTQAQQGRLKCFIYTLIALIVYWLILSFMRTLGEIGVINPYFSVWLPNILFFLTGIFLYFKKE
ncbi:MAG: LptF/LptG family permease, partial [Endomicrobia bacterium]|nr:LptF/LptG family permease [Endomicrobiia bacterium]